MTPDEPAVSDSPVRPGLTLTSTGGDIHVARMGNGLTYTVMQEAWSVKTDYYLDTFVHHLPDLVAEIRRRGCPLRRILEIGVARGVLSIGLALLTTDDTRIVGVDVEEAAVDLVGRNARANGVGHRIEVRVGSLFDPVLPGETFDLILGELPFIPVDPALQQSYVDAGHASEILNVSGGPDGRSLVDPLITDGASLLDPGGVLALVQPSFIGLDATLGLMARHGLAGKVLARREWRLADTRFTLNSRDYIERVNPGAFTRDPAGDEVFEITIVLGVKG